MNDVAGSDPVDQVRKVIQDYIRPNNHLLTMERIYENQFGEEISFNSWTEVFDEYSSIEWTDTKAKEFIILTKHFVEGPDDISETYFDILSPPELTVDDLSHELERVQYQPEAEGKNREGFQFSVTDDLIKGRYVYVDIDTQVTFTGGVNDFVTEGAIEFRIRPEDQLLIIESTRVIDVQKAKSVFGSQTNLEISVSANLVLQPDNAHERMNSFLDSFSDDLEEEEGPSLVEVNSVSLYHPDPQEDTEEIDFSGSNLWESENVQEHIDNGWIIKGIKLTIYFRDSLYDVRIGAGDVMSYSTISSIKNFKDGNELMDEIRGRFLTHLRS
ncbi:hypothetical protein ACFR9U_04555 [Halorientalis brevis]|uniref:Uncharacterized protein n=1 Tax=Halorientalis brevis TaxID=1126241 RepID=A0ABD6C7G9_9EURY|nr:hypothetical protein [Halorientalis brevis]